MYFYKKSFQKSTLLFYILGLQTILQIGERYWKATNIQHRHMMLYDAIKKKSYIRWHFQHLADAFIQSDFTLTTKHHFAQLSVERVLLGVAVRHEPVTFWSVV